MLLAILLIGVFSSITMAAPAVQGNDLHRRAHQNDGDDHHQNPNRFRRFVGESLPPPHRLRSGHRHTPLVEETNQDTHQPLP